MDTPHALSNYLKTTLNHGLNLSEVDWSDLKRQSTKHEPSLMEVDWGGKVEPNDTSSGCMLMQLDWGGKLRVDHINECMLSEVDWGPHDSIFFLYLVHIDHNAKPKDFFTQGLWGGLPQRTSSTPLME